MKRVCLLIGMVCLLALAGCDGSNGGGSPDADGTPDDARAMRWWNALNAEQMVAALYGDEARRSRRRRRRRCTPTWTTTPRRW